MASEESTMKVRRGEPVAWAFEIIPEDDRHRNLEKVAFEDPSETWETYDGFRIRNKRPLYELAEDGGVQD